MSKEFFVTPFPVENEQSTVWRYMDFTKFISLLDKKRLFLCRADRFEDSFEGSLPVVNIDNSKTDFYREKILEGKWGYAKMQEYLKEKSERSELIKRFVYISSWYLNEYESAAMWKLYAQTNEAVAIKSTVKYLRESLPKYDELLIGRVKYIDYKKEYMEEVPLVDRFFYKRKSFEYEEEVRVVIFNLNEKWDSRFQAVEVNGGIYVKTKIDSLIDEIYVAPNSPNWFQELVENVAKLYGINKPVIRTSLDDKALY
ncbi:MAG: hypothetical protein AABZ00_17975 [Chloroflexota bacterium]